MKDIKKIKMGDAIKKATDVKTQEQLIKKGKKPVPGCPEIGML